MIFKVRGIRKIITIMLIGCLSFCFSGCGASMDSTMESFLNTIKENENVEEIELSELTDFEWDEFYIFESYMSKEEMEEAVGFEIEEMEDNSLLDDNITCFLFAKDKECVGFFHSREENVNISFNFSIVDRYLCLKKENSNLFAIEHEDGTYRVTYITE